MPVHAVVANVQLPADKPFPKWRVFGIERGVPVLIPIEKLRVMPKAIRKFFFAKFIHKSRIDQIRLRHKTRRWPQRILFLPMHRNLRFVCFLLRSDLCRSRVACLRFRARLLGYIRLLHFVRTRFSHDGRFPFQHSIWRRPAGSRSFFPSGRPSGRCFWRLRGFRHSVPPVPALAGSTKIMLLRGEPSQSRVGTRLFSDAASDYIRLGGAEMLRPASPYI